MYRIPEYVDRSQVVHHCHLNIQFHPGQIMPQLSFSIGQCPALLRCYAACKGGTSLERKALGASVPLPKTVIRYILSAVLPRVLQRKLLGLLPQELGQYMLDAGQAGRLAGHFSPAC